jgi:hypothetical protein
MNERCGRESLIVETMKNLPQDMSLKEYFYVDCRMDLGLLALDRLLSTIPGMFSVILFKVRPDFLKSSGHVTILQLWSLIFIGIRSSPRIWVSGNDSELIPP